MPDTDIKLRKDIGAKIREARTYLGYSQDDLSAVLKIPRTAVGNIEAGTRGLDAVELRKLASFLEKPVAYFTNEPMKLTKAGDDVVALARLASQLTPSDLAELRDFAAYLEARAESKKVAPK